MGPELFISLLTPLLALVLSSAFWALWICRRENAYVAQMACAFLAVSAGFTLQAYDLGLGLPAARFLSNLLFMGTVVLLVSAVLKRRNLPVPLTRLGVITALTTVALVWFTWVSNDFSNRVIAVNLGLGAMCALGAYTLHRAGTHTLMDKLVIVIMAVGVVNFMARPAIEFFINRSILQPPDITSSYWLITSLTTIVYALVVALTMLTAAALDAIKELQAQTQTDPLSGLLNRRGFEVHGAQLIETYAAQPLPMALVMADLDHFKAVNDQHGHAAGDEVIAEFARRLVSAMGPNAIAGRLGGEEFAVLLPVTDLNSAQLFVEAVRASDQRLDGQRVTASYGVARWQDHEDLESLVHRCDAALYEAKRSGRDCVRVAPTVRNKPLRRKHFRP